MKPWLQKQIFWYLFLSLLVVLPGRADHKFLGVDLAPSIEFEQTKEKVELNGYAARMISGQAFFVAALYTTHPAKKEQSLLLEDKPAAMMMYFVRDDITPEFFKKHVIENILINNEGWDRVSLDKKRILELQKLITWHIHAGDVLAWQYTPKNGLLILFNGQTVAHWPYAKTFFNMLLRSWIGPFPPSREFKDGVLGRKK